MSRMNQVMQIGNVEGDIHYYIEDYAYTYLKKQKGNEKNKYFLYGEKEEDGQQKKLYIYGIAEKPKMEQTYFKEYYPLGFLKIKNNENFWVTLKGQEQKMSGFYVFYAPNQAMQEYLVDHRGEEKQDKPEDKARRQLVGETLPMKETFVPARKIKKKKRNNEFKNEKYIFPVGGIIVACLILFVLSSANGQKKIEIFKQVIAETMASVAGNSSEEDFIIEEKSIKQEGASEEKHVNQENSPGENTIEQENSTAKANEEKHVNQENDSGESTMEQESREVKANIDTDNSSDRNLGEAEKENQLEKERMEDATAEVLTENQTAVSKEELSQQETENAYEEYVVKNGDTLMGICKLKYGSLTKMDEICTINNIKNADYIAPGQKLYLP